MALPFLRLSEMRAALAATNLLFPAIVVPAAALVSLGADILLSRLMGAAEYGRYSLAYAVSATVVIFASLGVPTLLPRVVAESQDHSDARASTSFRSFLSGSFVFGLASTFTVGGACLAIYGFLVGTKSLPLLVSSTALSMALFVWLWCRGVAIGGRLILQATLPKEVLAPVLIVITVAIWGIKDAVLVCLVTSLAILTVHVPFLGRFLLPSLRGTTSQSRWRSTKPWMVPALSLGVTSLATIGFFRWDILILGIFVDAKEIAGYVAASKIALAAIVVQRIIEFGSTKYVVESLTKTPAAAGKRAILGLGVIAGLFAVSAIGVFAAFSDIALYAFGPFALAYKPHLLILLTGQCFVAITAIFDIAAVAGDAHRARAIWVVAISGLNLASNFYAALHFGSLGCAVATAVSTAVMRTGIVFIACRHMFRPAKALSGAA